MRELWSPFKAAVVVFLAVVVVGCIVGVIATSATGTIHDQPFARGQAVGQGVGVVAVIAGVAAYFIQARRRG